MYRTIIYVDAFNLYYGSLKGTPYKWLNVQKLCETILKQDQINKIRYFTALVRSHPNNPQTDLRQKIYLRALRTLPKIEIHYGHYLTHFKLMKRRYPTPTEKYVEVVKTEEKGSDVNIATHLMLDAFENQFDCAVIMSNDSDLLTPMKIVRDVFRKKVGVLNPHLLNPSQPLEKESHFFKPIRPGVLRICQFPDKISDYKGEISKPRTW